MNGRLIETNGNVMSLAFFEDDNLAVKYHAQTEISGEAANKLSVVAWVYDFYLPIG